MNDCTSKNDDCKAGYAPGGDKLGHSTLLKGLSGCAVLAAALCTPPAFADPLSSAYLSCARALGATIHDKFAILPGVRSGTNGLYVYMQDRALFLPLGEPDADDRDAQEFFVKTRLASVGDVFLNFREGKPGSRVKFQPGISYEINAPMKVPSWLYRSTLAVDAPDNRAWEVLSRKLREKASAIKLMIDEKNRYSTPTEAKAAFERDRVVYLDKLAQCHITTDWELRAVVQEEEDKLKYGFPGATIWEREIGQRRR